MAKELRVQYPGAIHHFWNRGNHREPIFRDDAGRGRFLETLERGSGGSGRQPV
jgi:hypothetical protein